MNFKTLGKRVLPIIIVLAIVIVVTVTLSLISKEKKAPSITTGDESFLTIDDITVTNKAVYKDLRFNYGINTLVTMIDRELLQRTKNANGKSFYEAVTEEEINKAIEDAKFPNGRTGDDVEDAETEEKWLQTQYINNGLRTEAQIKEYFRLEIAKKAYARHVIANDKDSVKDSDISNYYSSNYKKSYWVVVIKYNTQKEAENALNQLGIIAKDVTVTEGSSTKTVKKWVWAETETPLTEEEIKQAHIDLYNNTVAYQAPGYPNNDNPSKNLVLGEDQYKIVNGKIVFNTTLDENEDSPKNLFYYTTDKLNSLSSSLTTAVNALSNLLVEGTDLEKTYLITPRSAGSNYYYALKLNFVDAAVLYEDGEVVNEELKNEIVEKIIDSLVTATEINNKMADLRKENGLKIYDSLLEANYITSYNSAHKKTKKTDKVKVASIDGKDFTADELFAEMADRYGVASSYTIYLRQMLLRSEHNKIYDVDAKKILDNKEWEDIKDQVDYLKTSFANGSFGVDASYGWLNFLRDYNNVDSEYDLMIDLLYDEVLSTYTKTFTDTTEELWETVYVPNMQKIKDQFLSATGVHLLIYKQDKDGNIVDPEKWTTYEQELAKELYDMILEDLKTQRPDKYASYLETTVINAYNNAPRFLAGAPQLIENQPKYSEGTKWFKLDAEDYKYSKFKSAGLLVKYESLTTTAGVMVEPFENAVRKIWNQSEAANTYGDYKVIYDKSFDDYLVTEFGYHVYVNLTTTRRPYVTVNSVETVANLPARADVLVYEGNPIAGEEDRELTTLETKQVTTFYSPIRTEITGTTYKTLNISKMLLEKADKVQFAKAEFKDVYKTLLQYNIDNAYDNLKYITKPE